MTKLLAFLAALGLGLAACRSESSRVWDARDSFFRALARLDDAAVRGAVTPGYIAAERGRLLTIDSVVSELDAMRAESLSVQYAFADSMARVDPPMAWAVFHTRRISQRPSAVDTTFALASALFRRDGAGWRIALLHTTPLTTTSVVFQPSPTGDTAPLPPARKVPKARPPAKR